MVGLNTTEIQGSFDTSPGSKLPHMCNSPACYQSNSRLCELKIDYLIRGRVRSAMATRKCGNIYFPKYFMAVRPFLQSAYMFLLGNNLRTDLQNRTKKAER